MGFKPTEKRWSIAEVRESDPTRVRDFFSFSMWAHFLSRAIAQKVLFGIFVRALQHTIFKPHHGSSLFTNYSRTSSGSVAPVSGLDFLHVVISARRLETQHNNSSTPLLVRYQYISCCCYYYYYYCCSCWEIRNELCKNGGKNSSRSFCILSANQLLVVLNRSVKTQTGPEDLFWLSVHILLKEYQTLKVNEYIRVKRSRYVLLLVFLFSLQG